MQSDFTRRSFLALGETADAGVIQKNILHRVDANKGYQKMQTTEKLLQEYSGIFSNQENRPDWAIRKKTESNELIHPPIPFVGNNYNSTKVLLYASAENLMYYLKSNKQNNILDDDKIAINRHRYCFDNFSENRFFPYVHIAPIEDGSLLTAISYILKKLNIIHYDDIETDFPFP